MSNRMIIEEGREKHLLPEAQQAKNNHEKEFLWTLPIYDQKMHFYFQFCETSILHVSDLVYVHYCHMQYLNFFEWHQLKGLL